MRTRIGIGVMAIVLTWVLPVAAATISGTVKDTSGGALVGTRVVLRDVATRQETEVVTERRRAVHAGGADDGHLPGQRRA